jgi:hypothetical protein
MNPKQLHSQPQWQVQARIGLFLMCLATLSFYAICKCSFPTLQPPKAPEQNFTGFSDGQLQLLLSSLAIMNATLHAKIESSFNAIQQSGTWVRRQPVQDPSREELALLGAVCALVFWLVGAFIYLVALKNASMLYLKRTVSITLLAANVGLAYAVFWLEQVEWYTYFLCVLWPMQGVMAGKLFLKKGPALTEK